MGEIDHILDPEVLGHFYNPERSSGIARLFHPYAESRDRAEEVHDAIEAGRLIDTAEAACLDLLGRGIGVGRTASETDDLYRKRLKLEYMILTSGGTLEEIRAILVEALGVQPDAVWIHFNEAPSEALTDLPFYAEISLIHGSMLLGETSQWFKFSDTDARATGSALGFNSGKWRGSAQLAAQWLVGVNALLERILPTGVQYIIAARGGFRFSVTDDARTVDSDRGFDRGRWRGAVG